MTFPQKWLFIHCTGSNWNLEVFVKCCWVLMLVQLDQFLLIVKTII